jgi:hypothetical protein
MDAATLKQKAYIRNLLLKHKFRWRNINPLGFWEISKKEANNLINDLKTLQRHYSRDLRDMICQDMDGKYIIYDITRTIEEMEEEQADYEPTYEGWLEQQVYEDNPQSNEWIHDTHLGGLKNRR